SAQSADSEDFLLWHTACSLRLPLKVWAGGPMIRILVVDDDGRVREVVAAMLAALGHTVLQAPDGLAAITMLEAKSAVDLVTTDRVMPGARGGTLSRRSSAGGPACAWPSSPATTISPPPRPVSRWSS